MPAAPDADIVVWLFSLPAPPEEEARLAALLSPDEQARAARLRRPEDRRRHVAAHAAKRQILARAAGVAPEALAFAVSPWGRPELAAPAGLHFSLSHAQAHGALAVSRRGPVGVDVEEIRPVEPEVAAQFFSAAEQAALARLPPAQRLQGFYRCWTRREAVLKALGRGFSLPPETFDVTLAPGEAPRLLRFRGDALAPARWRIVHFDAAEDAPGAVAAPAPDARVAIRRWPEQA